MPTTRRSLGGAASAAGSPRAGPSTPVPSTSTPRRSTRSSLARQQTPQSTSHAGQHHHMSSDELALREAEQILHHPIVVTDDEELEGHHDLRSRAITPISTDKRTRSATAAAASKPTGTPTRRGVVLPSEESESTPGAKALGNGSNERSSSRGRKLSVLIPLPKPTATEEADHADETSDSEDVIYVQSQQDTAVSVDAPNRTDAIEVIEKGHDDGPGSPSHSESSAASESGSDSDASSSDPDTTTDEEDSDGDAEDDDEADEDELDALLAKARASAKQADEAKARATASGDGSITLLVEEEEDVLQLGGGDEEKKDTPIPDMAVPNLPRPHLMFGKDGTATAAPTVPDAGPSRSRKGVQKGARQIDEHGLELDDRPYERTLTKKEKAAQPRKATASELWASLPSAKSDLLPQMKRDYQTLALANSLDPKRFMKGGAKLSKVPESFAIGTLIEPPRRMQDTTLARETRYRPGDIVQGVVADQGTGDYAKRKYGDLQWNRMENGRGKGWKKRSKW